MNKKMILIKMILLAGMTSKATTECNNDFAMSVKEKKSFCSFQNSSGLSVDEQFVLKKFGPKYCAQLMDNEQTLPYLQCNYHKAVQDKVINIAQAVALSAYTKEFYQLLTPQNINTPVGASDYQGYDVFQRVLINTLNTLRQYPQYQHHDIVYRGTSTHGRNFSEGQIVSSDRFTSTSCVKEIAYGPTVIEKTEEEKAQVLKDLDANSFDEIPELAYMAMKRDPLSVPQNLNPCQKTYFDENVEPPLQAGSNFGSGDLKLTIQTAKNTKGVAVYDFSDRRGEAEILFPPGVKFQVVGKPFNNTKINSLEVVLKELED